MERINIKKESVLLFLGLAFVVIFMIAHVFSPVSLHVSGNINMGIAIVSENPRFVVYHPSTRVVNVINIPRHKLKLSGTDYQKAVMIFNFVSKNLFIAYKSVSYMAIDEVLLSENKFLSFFNSQKSLPKKIIKALKYAWILKKTEKTNLSWNDICVAYLEIIGFSSSNFIITDFTGNLHIDKLNLHMSDYNPVLVEGNEEIVKVEVFNASGVKKRAAKVTKYLRAKGVDVVGFGNFKSIEKKSKIVNCSDSIGSAVKIRDILGFSGLEIYSKYDSAKMSDAIVIIGADFNEENLRK